MSEIYWLITPDGAIQRIGCDGIMPLEQMQKLVGGYVEFTKVGVVVGAKPMNLDAVVNGDGWILNPPLPANRLYPHLAGNIILGRCAYGQDPLNGLEFFGVESDTLDELVPASKEPLHDGQ